MATKKSSSESNNREAKNKNHIALVAGGVAVVALFVYASFGVLPKMFAAHYDDGSTKGPIAAVAEALGVDEKKDAGPQTPHLPTPDAVKGIYMTSWIASGTTNRQALIDLIGTTELNTVMIDIKDDTGRVSYQATDPVVTNTGSVEVRISDLPELIKQLHDKNIYVIGRIAVFQDPYLAPKWTEEAVQRTSDGAVWKDRKGLSWIDAGSKKYWDYIVALAKDSSNAGFDEINFDYMRFPTDGNLKDMHMPRSGDRSRNEVIREFLAYIDEKMGEANIVTSGDAFGLVTTATDDMSIGQILEDALAHLDYVCPMVYPSHYANGSYGYNNPNDYPYEIIKTSMTEAVRRAKVMGTIDASAAQSTAATNGTSTAPKLSITDTYAARYKDKVDPTKLRPWLQDFDYGGDYDAADVRAQIKATYDSGLDSWLLWNASNRYTKEALLTE